MPINIGGNSIDNIRCGNTAVDRVYCGADEIWPAAVGYVPTVSYTGAALTNAAGSMAISDWSVTDGTVAATITAISITANGSGTNYNANLATDATSSSSTERSGGVTTTGSYGSCSGGTPSPAVTNVRSGDTYSYTGSQSAPTSTTAVVDTTTHTFIAGTDASARNVTVTVTYTVPDGYLNEGNSVMDSGNDVNQPGDTAVQTVDVICGTLSSGNTSCQITDTVEAASTGTTSRNCTRTATGTGSWTFQINQGNMTYVAGISQPASITSFSSSYSGSPVYSWSVSGAGVNVTGSGTSISFTTTQAGTVTISVSGSITDGRGNPDTITRTTNVTATDPNYTASYSLTNNITGSANATQSGGTLSATGGHGDAYTLADPTFTANSGFEFTAGPTFSGDSLTGTFAAGTGNVTVNRTVTGTVAATGCTGMVSSDTPLVTSNFGLPQCAYTITSTSGWWDLNGLGAVASGAQLFVNAFGNLSATVRASDSMGTVCPGTNTLTAPATCCPAIGMTCPPMT